MIDVLFANEIGARRMIRGDDAAGITQMGCESEIELIALIDFVDRHQRTLAHLACHHGVRSRSGKYQAERDGRLVHDEARGAVRQLSHRKNVDLSPCIINLRCASFVLPPHKKGASVSLTRLAALRHNNFVRECVHGERVLAQPMTSE
jgi:hypothetical protein